ncbi:MAG: hypothetical protein U1F25_15910, partial [Rubrivivax sp.]
MQHRRLGRRAGSRRQVCRRRRCARRADRARLAIGVASRAEDLLLDAMQFAQQRAKLCQLGFVAVRQHGPLGAQAPRGQEPLRQLRGSVEATAGVLAQGFDRRIHLVALLAHPGRIVLDEQGARPSQEVAQVRRGDGLAGMRACGEVAIVRWTPKRLGCAEGLSRRRGQRQPRLRTEPGSMVRRVGQRCLEHVHKRLFASLAHPALRAIQHLEAGGALRFPGRQPQRLVLQTALPGQRGQLRHRGGKRRRRVAVSAAAHGHTGSAQLGIDVVGGVCVAFTLGDAFREVLRGAAEEAVGRGMAARVRLDVGQVDAGPRRLVALLRRGSRLAAEVAKRAPEGLPCFLVPPEDEQRIAHAAQRAAAGDAQGQARRA